MKTRKLTDGIFVPIWKIGWSWVYFFALVPLLGVLAGFVLNQRFLVLAAFTMGPELPIGGLIYVHLKADDVHDTAVSEMSNLVVDHVPDNVETRGTYTLIEKHGNSLPLIPRPTREITIVVVTDETLFVSEDTVINLRSLSYEVGDDVKEYRHVTS